MIHIVTEQKIDYKDIHNATIEDVIQFITENKSMVALDTETSGFKPFTDRLLTLQIGTPDDQYVIDFTTIPILPLKPYLESVDTVLFHNAKFDWQWLYHHSIDIRNIYDTFLGEAVLTTGLESEDRHLSLEACALKYCNVSLDKTVRGKIMREGLSPRVVRYAAEDTTYLFQIREKQLELIDKYELHNVMNLENRVVRVFALMEYNGVLIDKTKWMDVAEQVETDMQATTLKLDIILAEELQSVKDQVEKVKNNPTEVLERWKVLRKFETQAAQYDLFSGEITAKAVTVNWSSNQQKLTLLKAFGIDVKTTDSRQLTKVRKKHKIIPLMLEYNKQAKLVSSFGRNFVNEFINPVTKRVHPNYFQVISSGRVSCSDPNLLNIPSHGALAKKIRSAFVAKSGYKIVGGDFSNFELRIIAECAEEPLWDRTFLQNGDLHAELCVRTFGIPYEDILKPFPLKPEYKYRDVQKTVDFMLAYGGSKFKLADILGIPIPKAQTIIDNFFGVIPKVKAFLDTLAWVGATKGYIRTLPPFRRIRWFPGWFEGINKEDHWKIIGEIERASKNQIPQGTNSDVIKLTLCNLQGIIDLHKYPVVILMSIYDEIQTECREDFAEEWKLILEKVMIESAEVVIHRIPIKVDVKVADCWTK